MDRLGHKIINGRFWFQVHQSRMNIFEVAIYAIEINDNSAHYKVVQVGQVISGVRTLYPPYVEADIGNALDSARFSPPIAWSDKRDYANGWMASWDTEWKDSPNTLVKYSTIVRTRDGKQQIIPRIKEGDPLREVIFPRFLNRGKFLLHMSSRWPLSLWMNPAYKDTS